MRKLLNIGLFFLLATTFFSCKEEVHQKLVGKWKLIEVPAKDYNEVWIFTETDVSRSYDYPDTSLVQNSGTYEMKSSSKIAISGPDVSQAGKDYFKGEFKIEKLNSTSLVLLRQEDGMIYYEFEKQ